MAHPLELNLDPLCEYMLAAMELPGLAVGAVQEGQIVYAKGFGVRSLATREPVTARSRHDNVRPFAVRHAAAAGPAVLWMSIERYVHYTDYRTVLKAAGPSLAPAAAAQR